MQSSESLIPGQVYTRADLKAKFGILDATINNGLFKPADHNSVWLFVTKEKTSDRVQYRDSLDGDILTMDGQNSGRTDRLIADHVSLGLELLLFYRDTKTQFPGAGFVYEGKFAYVEHTGALPASFKLERVEGELGGGRRTWDLALNAVIGLGGSATPAQVRDFILTDNPTYNTSNVQPDLSLLAVNSPSRTSYHHNKHPRRTDQGSEYDRLFKVGSGSGVVFELYDPDQHGVWEIYPDPVAGNKNGLSVRQATDPITAGVSKAEEQADQVGAFDPDGIKDARDRVYSSIVRRRGQSKFRNELIAAYGGKCAITGSDVLDVLEAAHVHPYRGAATNVTPNGLLLRADIHTLFDLYLISVDPETRTVCVAPKLAGTTYGELQGVTLRNPIGSQHVISQEALAWHWGQCSWAATDLER